MRPLDGDAQPVVAGAPTTWADEYVVFVFIQELAINLLDFIGNLWVVDGCKVIVGLDIHHVDNVL